MTNTRLPSFGLGVVSLNLIPETDAREAVGRTSALFRHAENNNMADAMMIKFFITARYSEIIGVKVGINI